MEDRMRPSNWLWYLLFGAASFLLFLGITYARPENTWNVGTYRYVAKVILGGGLPYRDVYDVKGPGIYYFYALAEFWFRGPAGFRILDALWQTATAFLLVRIGTRVYGREAAGWAAAAAFLVMQLYYASWAGFPEPDTLVSLPVGLGVLAMLRARDADRLIFWFFGGAMMGLAALLKLPAGLWGAAMIVLALRRAPIDWRTILPRLAGLAAGFSSPLLLCAIYFYARGALKELLVAQIVLAPQYLREFSAWGHWACIRTNLFRVYILPLYPLAAIALLGFVFWRRDALRPGEGLVLAWLAAGATALLLHGLFFPYHFMPLAAPLALLSGEVLAGALGRGEPSPAARLGVAALAGLYILLPVIKIPVRVSADLRALRLPSQAEQEWAGLTSSLRARTSPEDTLYIWGNLPRFYLDTERRPASRFFHSVYLSMPVLSDEARTVFVLDLAANHPKFFVANKAGAIGGNCPFTQLDYYAAFRRLTELQRFLEAEYVVEEDKPRYTLYRRKDVAAPAAQRERLRREDDRLAVGGAPVDGASNLNRAQLVVPGCGGCAFAGGGANE